MQRKYSNFRKLPKKGIRKEQLFHILNQYKKQDVDWPNGKIWGLVYYAGKEHTKLLSEVYEMFFYENALSPSAFPSLIRMEAEIVSTLIRLLGGDKNSAGTMTSGGTESILLAVKSYRDFFKEKKPQIDIPEMIIPITAHPAFLKAAHYFNVKPVIVPVDKDFKANTNAVDKACNKNTIMIVASSPSFPQGVIDPIYELGRLALDYGIGLHIDACLGGCFLPFLKKMGYEIPDFDLNVPGVTSLSADLHKYGYSAKGASAILYKNKELRRYQFFVSSSWPGGLYASPSMLGTRPGGAIAAAWLALMSLGENGYLDLVRETINATNKLKSEINKISGLNILGKPDMSVFSFTSTNANIFAIADRIEKKGWRINRQTNPDSLHIIVTLNHIKVIDKFLEDLNTCVIEELKHPTKNQIRTRVIIYDHEKNYDEIDDTREYLINILEKNYSL